MPGGAKIAKAQRGEASSKRLLPDAGGGRLSLVARSWRLDPGVGEASRRGRLPGLNPGFLSLFVGLLQIPEFDRGFVATALSTARPEGHLSCKSESPRGERSRLSARPVRPRPNPANAVPGRSDLSKNYPHVLHSSSWKGLDGEIPVLRRFLSTRCRDDFESDDVIQETLLRAARFRRHLHNREKMRAWILSIARNVLSDRFRRERRLGRAIAGDDSLAVEVACPSSVPEVQTIIVDGVSSPTDEVLCLLDVALEKLKQRDRDVLSTYYGGAMSCRETAKTCDLPVDLVKVRLFRARNRLRKYVEMGLSLQIPEERAEV